MLRAFCFPQARMYLFMASEWRPAVWGADYWSIIKATRPGKDRLEILKAYSIRLAKAHGIVDADDHRGDALGINFCAEIEDRKPKKTKRQLTGKRGRPRGSKLI